MDHIYGLLSENDFFLIPRTSYQQYGCNEFSMDSIFKMQLTLCITYGSRNSNKLKSHINKIFFRQRIFFSFQFQLPATEEQNGTHMMHLDYFNPLTTLKAQCLTAATGSSVSMKPTGTKCSEISSAE
jgi:hypothetical protein